MSAAEDYFVGFDVKASFRYVSDVLTRAECSNQGARRQEMSRGVDKCTSEQEREERRGEQSKCELV
jgi:hypothetical protein